MCSRNLLPCHCFSLLCLCTSSSSSSLSLPPSLCLSLSHVFSQRKWGPSFVVVSKIQWKPLWLATQLYLQNDLAGWCVNYVTNWQRPHHLFIPSISFLLFSFSFCFYERLRRKVKCRCWKTEKIFANRPNRYLTLLLLVLLHSKQVQLVDDGGCFEESAGPELAGKFVLKEGNDAGIAE